MSKKFFEAFPTLEVDSDIKSLIAQARVEKVASNTRRGFLRIYLNSERLISKSDILKLERELKRQLLSDNSLEISIHEKYTLSSQYDPETIMDEYRDSILLELNNTDHIMHNAFKNADMDFTQEGCFKLTIEDNVLNRSKEEELILFLDRIFNERFGCNLSVKLDYKESAASRREDEREQRINLKVNAIRKRMEADIENGDSLLIKNEGKSAADKVEKSADSAKADSSGNSIEGRASGSTDERKAGRRPGAGGFKNDFKRTVKKSDNPDVIFGRDFEEDSIIRLSEIQGEIGDVYVRGKILNVESRPIKSIEKTLFSFTITDFTDTMKAKIFLKEEQVEDVTKKLTPGTFIKLKAKPVWDDFDHEIGLNSIMGVKKIPDFTLKREDNAVKKRVELHAHTKMSELDGVCEAKALVKRAYSWGHKAVAITDHGVVQGFTDANHVWDDLWGAEKKKRIEAGDENPDKNDFFKIIYGLDANVVDDLLEIVTNDAGQSLQDDFVVFDIETTGFSPVNNRIIEIGAVKVSKGEIVDKFSTFVNPKVPIPYRIEQLTTINDSMVKDAPAIETILPEFLEFSKGCIFVAHNANFDMSFIIENSRRLGLPMDYTFLDTLPLARVLLPNQRKYTLDAVAKSMDVKLETHHRAVDDAGCTADFFVKFIKLLNEQDVNTLSDVNALGRRSERAIAKLRASGCTIYAKNDLGRINLYRLVSDSHLKYFEGRPKIPKSEILKHRDGLILGSGCDRGELFDALMEEKSDEQIARIVEFYDFLEICPPDTMQSMISSDRERFENINSNEDIERIISKIVSLGKQFNKPVIACGNAHFLDPEEKIYRDIVSFEHGMGAPEPSENYYFRTTEEMLSDFAFLGSDKAYEVVVENSNMIADMCETIAPVRPDKCAPVIPDSDKTLTEICYSKAYEMYGNPLPEVVEERLKRELNSIISNGFAVMYIIAQKLVWKSVEDGYLVGSRGSVGSSFVATMSGITEINPLSPHYYCTECHYSDFDSEEVKKYAGTAGIDMPKKMCPKCGAELKKDGFDIPFETFLGFKGDKEPDIDLNFSGEYQSKAHKYTEVIFGAGQTYRAGTVGTVADETAKAYARNYFDKKEIRKRRAEVERLAAGCTGVRRSTGQHPGGIIVLPLGEEINSFTPIQHPANDMTTDIVTTHFDYHSIDHNLLKLDILGHDDPTMIRMLQDLTGIDPMDIPLDGADVMSLFQNTEALGITPEDIGGTKLGALGIPEFGTDFAMGMLIDTKPKAFSDLVRIAGLAHGTAVWLGNAQDLILSGQATISTAICTRDDIMTYLIQMGLEPATSFSIMENVRKGKVAKGGCKQWPEWKADMEAHKVPDWYIGSCEKIEYMFPKAHAAAYVMMAWRIAWCKIHEPLAYYAAYFSIRAKAFNYENMCMGRDKAERILADYKSRKDIKKGDGALSNKEVAEMSDLRIVQEMYARGYEFMPIDLFRVKSRACQIIDGKIMPSLNSIEGLGEKAADAIVEAAKGGEFLSREDFINRSKASKTATEKLAELGILGSIPESNQISLFDFM